MLGQPGSQASVRPPQAAKRLIRAMSLPKELLDQLLSGYLDDALTADERIRVEQLLQSDSEVANELEQLRALRQSLQALSRVDSDIRLEQGFADRVLGAAVARAQEEGLADDHPLVRLAEQPSTATPSSSRSSWRVAATMVALAASIVIAVFMLRPSNEPDPGLVVQSETALEPIDVVDVPEVPEVESSLDIQDDLGPMLAESTPAAIDNSPAPQTTTNNPSPVVDSSQTGPVDSVASADAAPSTPSIPVPNEPALNIPMSQLGAILVVEVTRTEKGRENGVVANAMKYAKIEAADPKDVTDQIAGIVSGQVEEKLDDATVLFLQLPGKKFDLFYQRLWADEAGVAAIRMMIAMDPPLLEVADAVKVKLDPTQVRHDEASVELMNSPVVEHLAHELSQLPFRDVPRGTEFQGAPGTGPDVQAQVLVVVR